VSIWVQKRNHDVGHKNEEGKLNEEYVRRLRLIFKAELRAKNKQMKCRQLEHWLYQY
jgi:hypothetical protein